MAGDRKDDGSMLNYRFMASEKSSLNNNLT